MIFQLHSLDFPVSITVSVIQHFPVSVLVKVNWGLFFSYCAISVSVTVKLNRNNTALDSRCYLHHSLPRIFQQRYVVSEIEICDESIIHPLDSTLVATSIQSNGGRNQTLSGSL